MEIIRLDESHRNAVAPLIASFRVALHAFKGEQPEPDEASAEKEFLDFLNAGCPVFAASDGGNLAGYIVCRIEQPGVLWVEQIYVREDSRRRGVASMLFEKAEEIGASMGEDTVYNYVHPNNDGMIGFLRSKGYTVLNLIEIRKPYRNEKTSAVINVGTNTFDY